MKLVDGWWWPSQERHMIDWIANPKNRLVLNGRPAYQGKKQRAVLHECRSDRRRTMIDVGAHIGLWSYNFAKWGFKCIEAFEPVAAHRECFMHNLEDADKNLPASIVMHPFAVGDREGMVAIQTNHISTGDSWVHGKGNIRQVTLDNYALEDVDLIKIDCEGYEEFVLRGAEQTLRKWKPVVCVEQKRDMALKFDLKPRGAVDFLLGLGLGYAVVQEIGGDFILKVSE